MSLKPLREIAVPHPDVLNGTFQQSEFAADQVRSRHDQRISRALRVMKANGSPIPRFEMDESRTSFLIRLPVHSLGVGAAATDPVNRILLALQNGALPPTQLQKSLGLKHRPTFRENYLRPAVTSGMIEMTIPDKPSSRLQKYRHFSSRDCPSARHRDIGERSTKIDSSLSAKIDLCISSSQMSETIELQERAWQARKLEQIRQRVAENSTRSRYRLSRELCVNWNWVRPNGQLADLAARSFLNKLHERALIQLPPCRRASPNRMKHRRLECVPLDSRPVEGDLRALGALRLHEVSRDPVRRAVFETLLATPLVTNSFGISSFGFRIWAGLTNGSGCVNGSERRKMGSCVQIMS